jgi:hypothetical protein
LLADLSIISAFKLDNAFSFLFDEMGVEQGLGSCSLVDQVLQLNS